MKRFFYECIVTKKHYYEIDATTGLEADEILAKRRETDDYDAVKSLDDTCELIKAEEIVEEQEDVDEIPDHDCKAGPEHGCSVCPSRD